MRRLLALLFLALPLAAGELDSSAPLPVDPANRFGKLDNGMAYWIRPHATPPGKVSMMLHIHSGSLCETEAQRGLAHFLEHMAFNGSTNFPPGEMVKFFESLGMSFGTHQNAFTSFDQTTYMMILPDTEEATIRKVLLYFGDVAHRLLLRDEEIDKERGVILEEARARKGAQQRIMEEALPKIFPGSRIKDRLPIGSAEVVKTAPRDQFVDFYRNWYRPGNATLILCGDIDAATVEPWIKAAFRDWKPVEDPRSAPGPEIKHDSVGLRTAIFTDPELTDASISLTSIQPLREITTVGDFRKALVERMGVSIVNRRLREMRQKGEAVFQGGSVTATPYFNAARGVDVSADGDPAKWQEMFHQVLVEVKRAREHGFTGTEMEDARKSILAGAERGASTAPTRDASALMRSLNNSVTRRRQPMSPQQRLDLIKGMIPGIGQDEVHKAFSGLFRFDGGVISASFPKKEGVSVATAEQLVAAVKKAANTDVEKPRETERAKSFLAKDPTPAEITERSEDKDVGILTVTMDNGVRCHFRQMDFKKDSVQVVVRLVGGAFDETAATQGLTSMSAIALSAGTASSKTLSSTDISNLLTGKTIGFGGGPANGGMVFNLTGPPKDLEEGFRLLHLLLTQPKIEQAAVDRWKQRVEMALDTQERNARAQASLALQKWMTSGDVRMAPLTKERLGQLTTEAAQKWLEGVLANAPIEAVIVGDMDRARMVVLARKYLGGLPKRAVSRDLSKLRKVQAGKGPFGKTVEVDSITPQAVMIEGWRGPEFGNRIDGRRLIFTSLIASTRLTKSVREERGLAYSPGCRSVPAQGFDTSMFMVMFPCDPAKAAEAADVAKSTMLEMIREKPPTDAEIDAVRKQIQNILDTQMKQPSFWANVLSSLRTNGRNLEDIKNLESNYTSITKEQIIETLKKYLTEERFFRVIGTPKAK